MNQKLLLFDLALVVVILGVALIVKANTKTVELPQRLAVIPQHFAWRHCPQGCMKMLTSDPLTPCTICKRTLEVRLPSNG